MELWIRSQDNHLINFRDNDIRCEENRFFESEHESYTDGSYSVLNNDKWLGQYKSKERALEVLDEIQNTILDIQRSAKNVHEINYVYEMPKE